MNTTLRLLTFLRPFTRQVLLSVLLGSAAVAAGIGLLGTSSYLIARAALHPSIAVLQVSIVGVRFFGLSRAVFRYLERLVSHSVNFHVLERLRVWIYQVLEPLAPARLQGIHSGDLLARALADIETLENFYVRAVAPIVTAGLVTLGASFFVGSFHPVLGWALAAGMLLSGLALPVLLRWFGRKPGRELVLERAALNRLLVDGIQGMPDLLAFSAERRHAECIARSSWNYSTAQQHLSALTALSGGLNIFIAGMTLCIALLIGSPLVLAGSLDGISLAVISMFILASFEGVTPLAAASAQLESSLQAAHRLFELADAQPAVKKPADPRPIPAGGNLSIQGLTFRYSPELPPALQDFDLDLPVGKRVAMVGDSGAGKTSLLRVLLRFWDFESGEIRLDDIDLRDCDPDAARTKFSVVDQQPYLFSATLRDNLLLADPGATQDDLFAVLHQVQLSTWLAALPDGLDTWVGENGLQMSGGERRRLALARALLRGAPILLLDEPTASLDFPTAANLRHTLMSLPRERSQLWITHSLDGLEEMDEILVLQHGRVVEHGRHQSLLHAGSVYARMWEIQHNQI